MGSRSAPAKAIAMGALMIVGLLNPAAGSDFRLASGEQTGTAAAALSRINVPPLGTPVGKPLKGHTAQVEAVAVGKRSDGTPVIVSAGYDKTIRLWSLGS
ncbi:WD40 repeat domain-containing protein [Nonomuraea jabiensis]|uniref:WD40 repeat domain-containing protein n=1 Tax=Nonomuraea jabiensis TaxID=882448 RepID=UPI0034475C31